MEKTQEFRKIINDVSELKMYIRRNIIRIIEGFQIYNEYTLQGINISHLGKRKMIFKRDFWWDKLVPRRVFYKAGSVKSLEQRISISAIPTTSRLRWKHITESCKPTWYGLWPHSPPGVWKGTKQPGELIAYTKYIKSGWPAKMFGLHIKFQWIWMFNLYSIHTMEYNIDYNYRATARVLERVTPKSSNSKLRAANVGIQQLIHALQAGRKTKKKHVQKLTPSN